MLHIEKEMFVIVLNTWHIFMILRNWHSGLRHHMTQVRERTAKSAAMGRASFSAGTPESNASEGGNSSFRLHSGNRKASAPVPMRGNFGAGRWLGYEPSIMILLFRTAVTAMIKVPCCLFDFGMVHKII